MKLPDKKIRVAVFDDSRDRRDSLQYLIDMFEDMECVGTFADARDAAAKAASCRPDVVLMDIEMPGADGIQGVRELREAAPDVKVVMQTVFEDDEHLFESIKAGAMGYLLKKDDPLKTVDAIREAVGGGAPMNAGMAMRVLRYFHGQPQAIAPDYALTDKEKVILSLLVDGLSYKMIADRESISFHTVNSHIRKIYEKLQVHSMNEAVGKALKEGIV